MVGVIAVGFYWMYPADPMPQIQLEGVLGEDTPPVQMSHEAEGELIPAVEDASLRGSHSLAAEGGENPPAVRLPESLALVEP